MMYAQSCPTLCSPMDCSPPGSFVHSISQVRILEQVAISFSRGSSWPGIKPVSPTLADGFFTTEPPGKHWVVLVPGSLFQRQTLVTRRGHTAWKSHWRKPDSSWVPKPFFYLTSQLYCFILSAAAVNELKISGSDELSARALKQFASITSEP